MTASKKPAGKTAKKPAQSQRKLNSRQVSAATDLYNDFAAAGSTVSLAQLAKGMIDNGVVSTKEAATTLGITTTHLNQAIDKKVDGTGATDERRTNFLRLTTERLGLVFSKTAFTQDRQNKAAQLKAAANTPPSPAM